MPFTLFGLTFSSTVALWALSTLLIPILIHLFNRSRGRLVRTGHIDLLRQARKPHVTEVKLARWLLLLLRLGIFTLAALMLAGLAQPGLSRQGDAVVYLTPAWLKSCQSADLNELLLNLKESTATRVFLLENGFPELDPQQLQNNCLSADVREQDLDNVWPLLAERLSMEHHAGPVSVFATDYVQQYGNYRPKLPRELKWFISQPQSPPALIHSPIRAVITQDQKYRSGTKLFEAALVVIRQYRLPDLSWEIIDQSQLDGLLPDAALLNTDWLILTGARKLSPAQLAGINRPITILTDTHTGADNGDTLLRSADGSPLLQVSRIGSVRLLEFRSRFDSSWNSLAQQPDFPEVLLQLMLPDKLQVWRYADARISPAQLQSENLIAKADIPLPRSSLQSLLATLLILLWIAERWLSERKTRETA